MIVIKRDGTKVTFNVEKIRNAITHANERSKEMSEEDIERIVQTVVNKCSRKDITSVEAIQDIVEDTLLKSKFNQTAKTYILYRDQRTRNRENKSKLLRDIAKKLEATDIVNQNANVDEASFGGRKGEASNELMKWFALNNCMSKMAKENHLNNEIYIHDLDAYALGMHNCLSIPFDKLLAEGFNTRQTDIRPASSINTAFQLVAVIFQLQSLQQFGGVSATHLDWTMVPYVRKSFRKHYIDGAKWVDNSLLNAENIPVDTSITDRNRYDLNSKAYQYAMDQTTKELDQAVEGMYHNLNTLQSRSGNQLPFSSINYGTCTLPEGRMVIKSLLEGSIKGVGKVHRTPIFPCGIFQYMKGVNNKPGTPNYDLYKLALESTSKRLYPNFMNCSWSVDELGNDLDKKLKQEYLDNLSETKKEKLIEWYENYPDLADEFGLEIIDI
jgi:ribonucleoside-triphosphate reductase